IEHWNGTGWSVVRSPNPGATFNVLTAVAVVSANNVWAAGYSANNTAYSTLVEHWNGTKWTVVPSPNGFNGAPQLNFLSGIAVVSANDIWAVGSFFQDEDNTLTLHWNGTAWSVVSTPAIADSGFADLRSAVALSTDAVWTAGSFFQNTFSRDRTLTELWNGSAWSIVSSPNRGGSHNDLNAIAATP